MHLLPRSPRGTWILAGLVWAVACGILWQLWIAPDPDADTPPSRSAVRIWDAQTGREIPAPTGAWERLYARAGDFLGRLVRFCETGTWPPPVVSVAFTPDGRLVIADETVIPHRPPLSWVLAGGALLGLVLAGLAWWRVRRLNGVAGRGRKEIDFRTIIDHSERITS
jgi:hypothetical protein